MVTSHCLSQIVKRNIDVDIETIEMLADKSNGIDTAYILGSIEYLNEPHWVILICRHKDAITIEPRRKTQSLNKKVLDVEDIRPYPCLF